MKLFNVYVKKASCGEYYAGIVAAESAEAIRERFKTDRNGTRTLNLPAINILRDWDRVPLAFEDEQGEIFIEEIDTTKPLVLLTLYEG